MQPANSASPATTAEQASAWQRLRNARSSSDYCRAWLELECRLLGVPARGALFVPEGDALVPVAVVPEHAAQAADEWPAIAVEVAAQKRGLIAEPERVDGRLQVGLGCPVTSEDGTLAAVVVLDVEPANTAQIPKVMEALQWGISGLELMFIRQSRLDDRRLLARNRSALAIFAAALAAPDFHGAVLSAVTTMASELGCDRASYAVVSGLETAVEAMSHTSQHAPGMGQVRAIVAAMEDTLHAGGTVTAQSHDTPGFRTLAQESGLQHVLGVPGFHDGAWRGVLLLERGDRPFSDEERLVAESVVVLLLPMLQWRLEFAHGERERLRRALRHGWESFWAPASTVRRYVLIGLGVLLLLLAVIPADFRVTSDVVLEGAEKRAIVAPFDGFLATAPVRAGDIVKAGDVLATLDDRDLRLEQLKWIGQLSQYQGQYQQALGEHDRARTNISLAQMQQADAELQLVATRLERTQVTAPIDGLVLVGDLTQRLGSRVSQGEALYEIAPLADYRVVFKVDERYIADIAEKQAGSVVLSSLPDRAFGVVVTRVTSIATAEGGINYFRVEGRLQAPDAAVRPGMEGVGKVVAGTQPLLFAWFQPVVDWLRLWFWRWLP